MKILSAEYVLPINEEPISDGAVAVESDKIVAVGKRTALTEKFLEAQTENFGEAVIMPGFVNTHSHLEITAMRNFLDDVEHDFASWLLRLTKVRGEVLTESEVEISALWGALEGIRAGVTCFADIGRFGRAGFEALKKTGLRGTIFQETEFSPTDETADANFEKLKEKFLALKADETELVTVGISPHAPYTVSRKLFEKIADYALRENIKISIHAAESKEENDFMTRGEGFFAELYKKYEIDVKSPKKSPIEYLFDTGILQTKPLLAHCVGVSESDLEILKKTDSSVAHCPKSNAKFGHGIAPLEKFLDRKIRVGFGSDSVASNNTCDIIEESRFATLFSRSRSDKKRLLTASEIIETATLGGATALGLDEKIGTLEADKQADLIVISLKSAAQKPVHDIYSAVLFASNARDVILTMVAGREICRNGQVKSVNEASINVAIKEIASKMNEIF